MRKRVSIDKVNLVDPWHEFVGWIHRWKKHFMVTPLYGGFARLDAGRDQRERDGQRFDAEGRYCRRCHADYSAQPNQEQHGQTGHGDAPGQERHSLHFGMKAHIGVGAGSGLVQNVIGKAANVNYVTQGHGLLQGEETRVCRCHFLRCNQAARRFGC